MWEHILASVERCSTLTEMFELVSGLTKSVKPIRCRTKDLHFNAAIDSIDHTAMYSIPPDAPRDTIAIWTTPDGNCLTRALSKGYSGTEDMRIEIRERILIEAVMRKQEYLRPSCLNRGAKHIRQDETLPEVYTKYSDYYVSGQKITENTVEYMYT